MKKDYHVFPKQQEIHTYHGKKMTICTAEDRYSAEPAVEGFVVTVQEVFR